MALEKTNKSVEAGALFFTISLTAALYFSGKLPEYLEPLYRISKIKLLILLFVFSLALTRLITCIYFYSKPFKTLQWNIFVLSTSFVFCVAYIYGYPAAFKERHNGFH